MPNQEPRRASDHVDGSEPIFSLYLERASEEDKKMAENWKGDADGILIFVRHYHLFQNFIHTNSLLIDWSILCFCCIVDLSIDSRPPAESTRYIQLLPRQRVSGYDSSERIEFPPSFTAPVHSTELCSLGQRAVVLELGDQYYLRSPCDIATAVGMTIPQCDPNTLPPTQASSHSCVLRKRRREVSASVGGRSIAHYATSFRIPLLRRPGCLPVERQSHYLQGGVVLDRPLYSSLRLHHVLPDLLS